MRDSETRSDSERGRPRGLRQIRLSVSYNITFHNTARATSTDAHQLCRQSDGFTVGLSTASLRLTDDVRQLEQRLLRSTALHYFAIQTAAVNIDFPSARDDNKIRSYSSAYQCVTVLYKMSQPLL